MSKQDDLEKEVKSIGEYLGCNEEELWHEVKQLITNELASVFSQIEGELPEEVKDESEYLNSQEVGEAMGYNKAIYDVKQTLGKLKGKYL